MSHAPSPLTIASGGVDSSDFIWVQGCQRNWRERVCRELGMVAKQVRDADLIVFASAGRTCDWVTAQKSSTRPVRSFWRTTLYTCPNTKAETASSCGPKACRSTPNLPPATPIQPRTKPFPGKFASGLEIEPFHPYH